jgi:aminopeptidase C
MTFSEAFYVPKAGIVDAAEPVDPVRRHAVVAVAAGRSKSDRFLMVRNSWGQDWGVEGHAWLAERYLAARVVKVVALKEVA